MNKFLIAVSALLAMSSICDAYGQQSSTYGAPSPAAAIVYQTLPAVKLQVLIPASAYAGSANVAQVASGYGTPLSSGYGAPVIGLPAPLIRKVGPIGDDIEIIRLAELALSLPNLPAIISPNKDLLPSNVVYGPAAPLVLPAPIGTGYKIPVNAPESASASAVADSAGNKLGNSYAPVSVVPNLGVNVGPTAGSIYAPAPRPVILPAPTPVPAAVY